MSEQLLKRKKVQFGLLLGLFVLLFLLIVSTIYFFIFKNTHENYSLTQSYKEYYSVEDWNLTMHAIVDMDNDGSRDMLTFTNCAFFSSVSVDTIPMEKRCEELGMSTVVFPENATTVGQKLSPYKSFFYTGLRKSYLVKTNSDIWKYYDINGFQLRTYQLDDNFMFNEVQPTLLDRIDVFTYQTSHLGVILLLIALP